MLDHVYKVVTAVLEDGDEVYWGSLMDFTQPWTVQYLRNEKAYPLLDGSFLYAFDNRESALAYVTGAAEILKPVVQPQVWEANAHIVATQPTQTFLEIEITDFWGMGYHGMESLTTPDGMTRCADHTVWCEWIELTRKIRGERPQTPPEKRKKGWPAGKVLR